MFDKAACGANRSQDIACRVKQAISSITNEMNTNGGVYPENGGSVTKNEIIRRAGIGKTTLFSKTQVLLNRYVDDWLLTLREDHFTKRGEIRASHAERAAAWKEKYECLATAHHLSELELQQYRAEMYELKIKYFELEELYSKSYAELESLRKSNVVRIRPR